MCRHVYVYCVIPHCILVRNGTMHDIMWQMLTRIQDEHALSHNLAHSGSMISTRARENNARKIR